MADPNTSAPTPDVSNPPAMPTPAATPIPDTGSQIGQTVDRAQHFEDIAQNAGQKATALAQPTPPAPPPPHARLLAMVQGLSVGLSAAATSLATNGREGGAKEVQQVRAAQQAQKLQAQEAATAQKNAQIQQQLTIADTNHKMAQNVMLMATLPSELTQKDLATKSAALGVIGQTQDIRTKALQDLVATGDLDAYNKTVQQVGAASGGAAPAGNSTTPAASGAAAPSTGEVPPMAKAQWQNATDAAVSAYPNDSTIKQYATVLADPNSDPKAMAMAATGARNRMAALDAGTKSRAEQQAADPLYKLENDPAQMEGPKASAAIPMLQNMLDNETDPAKKGRETHLLAQAQSAHNAYLADQQSQEKAKMIAQAGDPKMAGQALAEGDVTLADLKSRGSTPGQIIEATNEAKKYAAAHGSTYNAADEITGEQVLKGQTTQTFFGSARSLVQQGGMLDQLKEAHNNLGNQQIPAFNKIEDWVAFQAGTPELAAYKQAVLAAADDYAKVMGGGSPNLEQFNSLRDGFAAQLNNKQMKAAIDVARNSVRSQVTGRIGTNRYILQREGDILHDAPTPQSHVFDSKAWAVANPGKDVNAAIAAAKQQGYEVQ